MADASVGAYYVEQQNARGEWEVKFVEESAAKADLLMLALSVKYPIPGGAHLDDSELRVRWCNTCDALKGTEDDGT